MFVSYSLLCALVLVTAVIHLYITVFYTFCLMGWKWMTVAAKLEFHKIRLSINYDTMKLLVSGNVVICFNCCLFYTIDSDQLRLPFKMN